jgi:hypothetical protein
VPERRSHRGHSGSLTGNASAQPQVSQFAGDGDAAPQTSQADSAGSIPVTRSKEKAQVGRLFLSLTLAWRGSSSTVRTISGTLASGDQYASRTVVIVAAPRLLGLDVRVDRIRDRLVNALGLV